MSIKDILSGACAMGAGLIGFNAANKFKGNQKYLITKVLTTAGAFGIADMLADNVNKHIDKEIDDFITSCNDILGTDNKEKEEKSNVIDITESRTEEES